MKKNYKILSKFIKDLSSETPDIKTPVMKPDPIDTAITGSE